LRRLLTSANNLDRLQYLLCIYLQNFVFSTCPSADPVDLKVVLIRRLGQELRAAIIKKLRRYYPKDASRDETALLRYYPDRGIALLQQALGRVHDIWTDDQRKHNNDPNDTLVKKCQRLLPLCADLPDLKGKSALGRTSRLFGLVVYEDVMLLLHDLPQAPRISTADNERRRTEFFTRILEALRSNCTGLTPPPPLKVTDIFAAAATVNFNDWLTMSRSNIALDVVSKTIGQNPNYFRANLKDLRLDADGLKLTPLKPVL
jgi:hypothetical protein